MRHPLRTIGFPLLALCVLFVPAAGRARVAISEVMWPGTDLSTSDEWLELANGGTGAVSLAGWRVTGVNSAGQEVTLLQCSADMAIAPGEYLVMSRFPAAQSRLLAEPALVSPQMSLANTKLLLRLYNGSGALVDTVDDGVGAPFAGSNTAPKASMERVDVFSPGNMSANWHTAATFTGFDDGASLRGTPGAVNFSGLMEDTIAPLEATDVVADVIDAGAGRTLHLVWRPSISLDLVRQELRFDPALPTGSSSVLLPATATGYSVELDRSLAYTGSLVSIDAKLNESDGVVISIEPYTEPIFETASSASSEISSQSSSVSFAPASSAPSVSSVPSATSSSQASSSSLGCAAAWDPQIHIQSGQPRAEGKVTINIELTSSDPPISKVQCRVDFGDGTQSQSCNPPSHTYASAGTYRLMAELVNQCGTTMERYLDIEVSQIQNVSGGTSGQTGGGQDSGSTGTADIPVTNDADFHLAAVLPNPEGTDTGNEWIEVRNAGAGPASLAGFSLRAGGKTHRLPSIGFVGVEVRRLTQSDVNFSLTNASGSVALLGPAGDERGSIRWKNAVSGKIYRPMPAPGRYTVRLEKTIDGDTLDVSFLDPPKELPAGVQRVRMLGIDAPEVYHTNKALLDYGITTMTTLEALLKGKKIELEFDTEFEDGYGRLLAYVYADGALVQEALLTGGLASALTEYPHTKLAQFEAWEAKAKDAGAGHWGRGYVAGETGTGAMVTQTEEQIIDHNMYSIILSEVFPSPTSGEKEWIELWNPLDVAVSLEGLVIDDVVEAGSKPHVLEDISIAPHSFLALYAEEIAVSLNNTGDTVRLLDAEGEEIESVTYTSIKTGQSYALTDGGMWCTTLEPTPGGANICVAAAGKTTSKKAVAPKATGKKPVVRYTAVGVSKSSKAVKMGSGTVVALTASVISGGSGATSASPSTMDVFVVVAISSFVGGLGGGVTGRKFF